ncbi:unnamed protein product [Rotaria sp. Silwood1]|nr:unnamed protein product [Rotaria sp. Silwood1]
MIPKPSEHTLPPHCFQQNNRKICEILNTCDIGKKIFQEFDKLIRLYLTIPVTTATSERAFSVLDRVKNTLRSCMTQSRLNHCLLAHIYKEKLDKIDSNQIMSTFITSNEQRGIFWTDVLIKNKLFL